MQGLLILRLRTKKLPPKAFRREIFDCYLRLEKEARNRQAPSPSQSVESQLNTVETSQEADDCRERNDVAAPTFASDVS